MKKKILIVVGTRPNFIKVTQFPSIVREYANLECKIVHTGQHFDRAMSSIFFEQFNMQPDLFLNVKQGSAVAQMAEIMVDLEKVALQYMPDIIMVPGDVNTTLAAAITANKMNIPIAHLEAGLRSFDRTMPEEFNRLLTDNLSDIFFVTEQSGYDNLVKEGHEKNKIHFVGNTMIDTMVAFRSKIYESSILTDLKLEAGEYILMTMHRPATVDSKEGLSKLSDLISTITKKLKLVFPLHPRTVQNLENYGLLNPLKNDNNLILSGPLDYFAFQKLVKSCLIVITDSGGIQEETTFLQIPCLTLRSNTERPATVTIGSNELIPFDAEIIEDRILKVQAGNSKKGAIPPLWDGKATQRIVKIIADYMT